MIILLLKIALQDIFRRKTRALAKRTAFFSGNKIIVDCANNTPYAFRLRHRTKLVPKTRCGTAVTYSFFKKYQRLT